MYHYIHPKFNFGSCAENGNHIECNSVAMYCLMVFSYHNMPSFLTGQTSVDIMEPGFFGVMEQELRELSTIRVFPPGISRL